MIRDCGALRRRAARSRRWAARACSRRSPRASTEVAYGKFEWKPSKGEDRYRRGLYTFTKRTAPFAMFNTFDAPTGEACLARREVSNTPLQALTCSTTWSSSKPRRRSAHDRAAQAARTKSASSSSSAGASPVRRTRRSARRWSPSSASNASAPFNHGNSTRRRSPEKATATSTNAPRGPRWRARCSISTKPSPEADAMNTSRTHCPSPAAISSATAASGSAKSRSPAADGFFRRASCDRAAANPLAPTAAAFSGEGEARHPSLHGRRAVAARPVRLQAGAGEARRASRFRRR